MHLKAQISGFLCAVIGKLSRIQWNWSFLFYI